MKVNQRLFLIYGAGIITCTVGFFLLFAFGVITANVATPEFQLLLGSASFVGLIALTTFAIFYTQRPFVQVLPQITTALKMIARGEYETQLPAIAPGELNDIVKEIRELAHQLDQHRRHAHDVSGQLSSGTEGATDTIDHIQTNTEIQVDNTIDVSNSVKRLSSDLEELMHTVESLVRSVQSNALEASQIDNSSARVNQMINALSSSIDQASSNNREGTRQTRNLTDEIKTLSDRILSAHADLQQMINLTRDASRNAETASNTMSKLQGETEGIGEAIEAVISGTNAIHFANEKILQVTESLESRVDQVDGVIEVIRNLAERTKLLSINASIIASEAGEHGKAFAVVASEVKDLAGSTGGAISEISKIVSDLKDGFSQTVDTISSGQDDVDRGVGLAREAVVVLRTIPDEVRVAASRTQDIVDSTSTQFSKFQSVETIISESSSILSNMSSLLDGQIQRNDEIVALYANISTTSQQALTSTKEHSNMSSSLLRGMERVATDSALVSDQLRDRLMTVQEMARLTENIMNMARRTRQKTVEAVGLISRLQSTAQLARENLDDIAQ